MFLVKSQIKLLVFSFLLILSVTISEVEAMTSTRDKALKEVFDQVKEKMTSKYKARCFGSGGAMMTDIKVLDLAFYLPKSVSVEDARGIIVDFAELFLSVINQNNKIKPYLANYPFEAKNLALTIAFENEDGTDTYDPNLSSVILTRGKVFYISNNFESLYDSIDVYEEPYSEALSKARGE